MLLEGITEDENNLLTNPPGFLDEDEDGEVLQQNYDDDADNLLIWVSFVPPLSYPTDKKSF